MNAIDIKSLDAVLHQCIHCGMCLPVCPTYNLTFQEQSSPRGRIRLIRSVQDGTMGLTDEFVEEMNFCLDCQACQTACPAGVQYGVLVEDARRQIAEAKKEPLHLRFLKYFFLRVILGSKRRTKLFGRFLKLYEASGLRDAIEQSNILTLFSEKLHAKHLLLPRASGEFFDDEIAEVLAPTGPKRGTVAFLSGCIMNVSFADVHRDAVEVLRTNGFEVVIPKLQVCCGSLHGHNGDVVMAKKLAQKNLDVFGTFEFDALVIDSAGCSAFLKEYGMLFADDPKYASRAVELSNKTKDITEFLVDVGMRAPTKPLKVRVTYHDACHLVHTQKISEQPRQIIRSIPGIEFVELPESTWCCGSAGMYNVTRFDDSMKFLERKMNNLASTNAEIVVTANPGCHLQLQYGIRKFGLNMEVVHPVTLLRRAYG
ncbi:MAG: (Fe-S)-binding protein [Ignavibacteriae bacterium]|nr:(Fe-S)-binding protein [Ignavibacteria bacterium]MBI3364193.1 (Fe-S)-binding protein [Ignavibacteriota bacterium]